MNQHGMTRLPESDEPSLHPRTRTSVFAMEHLSRVAGFKEQCGGFEGHGNDIAKFEGPPNNGYLDSSCQEEIVSP